MVHTHPRVGRLRPQKLARRHFWKQRLVAVCILVTTALAAATPSPRTTRGHQLHDMAALQAVCDDLGLECELPKVAFVGMESTGKTTLLEIFLRGSKVGFQGINRATLCPVVYQVLQRDDIKEGSQLDGHWYSASITFRGKTQSVSLDALATEIGDHMGRIHREDTPLTTDIMRVAIKTNDPAFTSMYLYDLPGLINSNAEATADSDDKVVEGLQHIVESVLSKFGKHDTIVVVAKADTVPSHFGLLNKRSEGFNLMKYDPERKRIVVALTMADFLPRNSQFAPPGGADAMRRREQEWENVLGTQPFYVVTHHVQDKDKLDFVSYRSKVTELLGNKQAEFDEFLKNISVDLSAETRFTFAGLENEIQRRLLQQYQQARGHAIEQVHAKQADLLHQQRLLKEQLQGAAQGDLQSQLKDLVHRLLRVSNQMFLSNHPFDYRERKFAKQCLGKLSEDLEGFPRWPAIRNRTFASESETSPDATGPARGDANVPTDFTESEPSDELEAYFLSLSKLAAVPLCGSKAVVRLLTNMRLRATHIEPNAPTLDEFIQYTSDNHRVDTVHSDTAIGQLVADSVRAHLGPKGVEYAIGGIRNILRRMVDPAVEYVLSEELPIYKKDLDFHSRIKTGFNEAIDDMLAKFQGTVQDDMAKMLAGVTMALPAQMEQMSQLLVPAVPEHRREGGGSSKELTAGQRSDLLATVMSKPGKYDRAPSDPIQFWDDDDHKDAVHAFARQFGALRELMADSIRRIFSNSVPILATDAGVKGGLFSCLTYSLIDRHLLHVGESNREEHDRLLEAQYGISKAAKAAKQRLDKVSADLAGLLDGLNSIHGGDA